jgi:GDP-D-mannose dehydratase
LIGGPSKTKLELGWSAKTKWKELAELMVDDNLKEIGKKLRPYRSVKFFNT